MTWRIDKETLSLPHTHVYPSRLRGRCASFLTAISTDLPGTCTYINHPGLARTHTRISYTNVPFAGEYLIINTRTRSVPDSFLLFIFYPLSGRAARTRSITFRDCKRENKSSRYSLRISTIVIIIKRDTFLREKRRNSNYRPIFKKKKNMNRNHGGGSSRERGAPFG